jgi:hypothetical protein
VSREAGVELLAVGIIAVCDEEVLAQADHFLGLVAEVLVVLGRESHELPHLLTAQVDVVHKNQHFLGLTLALLPAHPLLHRRRQSLRPRCCIYAHPQQVLAFGIVPEHFIEGVGDGGGFAAHWFAPPEHVLAVAIGVQVDVLVEPVPERGNVDFSQSPDFLERRLQLHELSLAVSAEAEAVIEDGFLAHH